MRKKHAFVIPLLVTLLMAAAVRAQATLPAIDPGDVPTLVVLLYDRNAKERARAMGSLAESVEPLNALLALRIWRFQAGLVDESRSQGSRWLEASQAPYDEAIRALEQRVAMPLLPLRPVPPGQRVIERAILQAIRENPPERLDPRVLRAFPNVVAEQLASPQDQAPSDIDFDAVVAVPPVRLAHHEKSAWASRLMPQLVHQDNFMRTAGVEAVGRIGGRTAEIMLIAMLGDPREDIRYSALEALSKVPEPATVLPALRLWHRRFLDLTRERLENVHWLTEDFLRVYRAVVSHLEREASLPHAERGRPAPSPAMTPKEAEDQRLVDGFINNLGPDDHEGDRFADIRDRPDIIRRGVLEVLMTADLHDAFVLGNAMGFIEKTQPNEQERQNWIRLLEPYLLSSQPPLRLDAISTLGALHAPSEMLVPPLYDQDWDTRLQAMHALASSGDPEAALKALRTWHRRAQAMDALQIPDEEQRLPGYLDQRYQAAVRQLEERIRTSLTQPAER